MTNAELKDSIIDNTLSNDLLILQASESYLLANQYAAAIAQSHDLEIQYIAGLADIDSYRSCLDDYCPYLFVLHVECFAELRATYTDLDNTVIICKTIDKKISKSVEQFVIKLDKLEPWQLQDYIIERCPGLSEVAANNLYMVTQGNVDRIEQVCNQLDLFEPTEQGKVLNQLCAAQNTDLYYNTAFNLVDAIVNVLLNRDATKNLSTIHDILMHRTCCDLTALYVNTILLAKLRNIAIICYGGTAKAADFLNKDGKPMSDKQYYFFRRSYVANATTERIIANRLARAIKFSSNIDAELKLGKLEFSSDSYLLDYILVNVLSC